MLNSLMSTYKEYLSSSCICSKMHEGKILHYATKHLPREQIEILEIIHSIYEQLVAIAYKAENISISKLKFNYWEKIISNLSDSGNLHPLLDRLAESLSKDKLLYIQEKLLISLHCLQKLVVSRKIDTNTQMYEYINSTEGQLNLITCCIILDKKISSEIIQLCYELAAQTSITNFIRYIGSDINKNLHLLPEKDLSFELLNACMEGRMALFGPYYTKAEQHYASVKKIKLALKDKEMKNLIRLFSIQSEYYEALLRELLDLDFPVLKQRVSLNPIRKKLLATFYK